MAQNNSGSMNASLAEGMSDGVFKKVITDRSNAEPLTYTMRSTLDDTWFGIHETSRKPLGDGTVHLTPDYVRTPPPAII